MTAPRPRLRALAERLGILPFYWDIRGRSHPTSDATCEALAAAMGFAAPDEAAAAASQGRLEAELRAGLVDPVYVWRQWHAGAPALRVRAPAGAFDYEIALRQEDGRTESVRGRVAAGDPGRDVELALPFKPAEGYHAVDLTVSTPESVETATQSLVLAPRTCAGIEDLPGNRRRFGLWANLYSVRSERSCGAGDLGDLGRLLRWAGAAGADFVGINPLHALRNRGLGVSPYGPVSRIYRNVLYLDLGAIPELAASAEARALLAGCDELRALRAARRIDHARVFAFERRVLEALYRQFANAASDGERAREFAAYRAREGDALADFATFCAIEEHLEAGGERHVPWSAWPAALRDPRSEEVRRFRERNADAIAFHAWLQFEIDRQLALARETARDAGLAVGVYQDLAVGIAPDGADVWAFPGLFARGASTGAPPDDYASQGQDWGLPPLDPIRLRASGYRYWIRVLRAGFAHSGALRIDHVMGLFRLFWIPAGAPSTSGTYVRYPADDLLGILALESRRHGALVVGEDLGTVPDEVRPALASWGILSSRVLLFEREPNGAFRAAASYPERAIVTATTHDLPTLAAFRDGSDLALRERLGLLAGDAALAAEKDARRADLAALEALLRAEGLLADGAAEPSFAELCAAVTAFLCRTPSALAGLSLDDLAGEREPVNVPGVPLERFASWSRRMERPLEALAADPGIAALLAAAARARPR